MKKIIADMEWEELKELYDVNSWLRDQVVDEARQMASDDLNEIADVLRRSKGVANFQLGGQGDFIQINDNELYQFALAIKSLDYNGLVTFNVDIVDLLTEAKRWNEFFWEGNYASAEEDDEFYDEEYARFVAQLDEIIEAIIDHVRNLDDYDEEYCLEWWAERNGDDYATDGRYIYQTVMRRFA